MKPIRTTNRIMKCAALLAAATLAIPSAFAASQTWSPTPVSQYWSNSLNWVGGAAPGGLNIGGNSVNNDTATFNSPLFSGIGGAGLPILTDDATATNGVRSRQLGSIIFDTANCGAYVFQAANPFINNTDPNLPQSGILYLSHNGSIRINEAVTNSQVFLVPVHTRLPSSTAGIYNLVNNATNPAVTLTLTTLTNNSATSRGTDWRFGGTNTGNNTVGFISAGTTTGGANGLTKQGPGKWILTQENDLRSGTVVQILDGTLVAQNAGVFSLATTATVSGSGVLQLDAVNLYQPSLNLNNGGTIRMNGTASLNGVAVGTAANTVGTLATTSASDVFTVGTGLIANSVVSGGSASAVLRTAGPGTIYLSTANTYVGNWSLEAATNQIANYVFSTAKSVSVAPGATLDLSLLGYYSLGSGSFGATGTGVGASAATVNAGLGGVFDLGNKDIILSFAPTSFAGDTTHPSLYVSQGSISLNGNFFTVNNTSGTPLGAGTYRLIQQASGAVSVSGGPFAVVLGAGLQAGMIGDIQVSGGNVNLVVSPHVSANLNWQGGNPGNVWDSLTTANFNNGSGFAQFGNGDAVTFGPLGFSFPSVSLSTTVLPSSVKVDTSANNYTLSGGGQIAGPASLSKVSTGTLTLETANAYLGGTTISNGTIKVGIENAIPSAGSGNVALYAPAAIDLNGFNNRVNGLNGDGTVDNLAAATTSILTAGNNNSSGTLGGPIRSSAGSVALTKVGTGTLTLSASNSYSGGTTLSAGTLTVANPYALGTSNVTVDAGTLNVATDLRISALTGSGGTIVNNANANTNTITITGTQDTIANASIGNGTGGGGLAVRLLGGSLTFAGNNTYTGGTFVGSGATFAIPNAPAAVGGFVIASNNSYLYLSGGSGTPGTPSAVTTVDGATVYFNSGAEGKLWQAQFNGGPTATNRIIGPLSAAQPLSYSNFLGVVELANTNQANANFRFFNGGGISGGENTLFVFERVNMHTRDSQTVRLGAIAGGSMIAGIGDQTGIVSWEIGAKNTSMNFHGYISGVNNSIAKVGTGSLNLDGRMYWTNTVTLPDNSIVDYVLFTNAITYLGSTTVSNGTLKIVAPNNLTNSPNITLAGGTLDMTTSGYATNETIQDINLTQQPNNTVVVTTGTLGSLAGQSLNGTGSILGNVVTDPASTINPGLPIGTLAVSGSLALNGTVNMGLDRTNLGQNSDRITAASIVGTVGTLNVTNVGPTLIGGTTFQLFNHPVTITANLPATDASGQITYLWQNDLASDGSIKLLTGVNPVPAPITVVPGAGTLNLSWPADHIGWELQTQTNALTVGISNNWTTVAGSTLTNQITVPIVPANPTVFYRLYLP